MKIKNFTENVIQSIQEGINSSKERYEKERNYPYVITTCNFSINLNKRGNVSSKEEDTVAIVGFKINYLF